jgi:pimeloyl-ACP methyl ester carboxylesterase
MIHGAGLDHSVWRYQSRYLAHHGRNVAAIDLPGHGRTSGPPLSTVEQMAQWIAREWLGTGSVGVSLIGHSLGALVALEVASHHPQRVDRLALISCGPAMRVHPELQAAADQGSGRAIDLIIGWSFSRRGKLGGHREPGLWQTGVTRQMFDRGLRSALGVDLAASAGYAGGQQAAGRVVVPTLVVAGEEDRMVPVRASRELADLIPGASLEVVAHAGHMLPLEAPDILRNLLGRFVPSE